MRASLECPAAVVDQEYRQLLFSPSQAMLLHAGAQTIAACGGTEDAGAVARACVAALHLYRRLDPRQQALLQDYADGRLAVLEFRGLHQFDNRPPPLRLPALRVLQNDPCCRLLAARNQILLHLAQHRAFAFDLDNGGRLVRFVGNFRGGGQQARPGETAVTPVELSSHAGLALGPHTEAPYHCALQPSDDHSPAPSALILSARWNPLLEPTCIIPMAPVIERLSTRTALALTSPSFDYSRSDSFVAGSGAAGRGVSILQFDPNGGFALRYNSYRFSLNTQAGAAAADALEKLTAAVNASTVIRCVLTPCSAVLINNYRALHCRDIVRDNRRLLIRLFGYSRFVTPIVMSEDPLIVKG
jgi:hypothetical protein